MRTIFVLHGPIGCCGTRRSYEKNVPYRPSWAEHVHVCEIFFLHLAHVNVFESQLEPPVAIVSALLLGGSAAFPTVSFCLCERDLIYSFWQPFF